MGKFGRIVGCLQKNPEVLQTRGPLLKIEKLCRIGTASENRKVWQNQEPPPKKKRKIFAELGAVSNKNKCFAKLGADSENRKPLQNWGLPPKIEKFGKIGV